MHSSDYTPPSYGPAAEKEKNNYGYSNSLVGADGEEQQDGSQKQITHLIWTQLRRTKIIRELSLDQMYNHIDGINVIATKSGLFMTLRDFYKDRGVRLFDVVPDTYMINVECKSPAEFEKKDRQLEEFMRSVPYDSIWILKPGENTNRG